MPGRLIATANIPSFVCPRCQVLTRARQLQQQPSKRIRWSSTSASRSTTTEGSFPPLRDRKTPAFAHLTNRSLIRLQGEEVASFLDGLLPAQLQKSTGGSTPIFTAFLSAKGRILYEAFIYPPKNENTEPTWYVDVDTISASALFSHLKKHKLRRKFKLEKVPAHELGVYYIWPGQDDIESQPLDIGGQDPRPLMGSRFLSGVQEASPTLSALKESGSSLTIEDYHIHRILSGHAEGPTELVPSSSLPQESNIDFDGGIDFHKGCYLGQELTIRTHHTGIVRKRILPCQIYSRDEESSEGQLSPVFNKSTVVPLPPSEANISKLHAKGRAGRSTGKWLGGVGNVGLALCRLEMMTDIQVTAEGSSFDPDAQFSVVWEEDAADADGKSTIREVGVKPFVPDWLRNSIEAGVKARSDRSKRRRQADEEDDDEDVE